MTEFKCNDCGKEFSTKEALEMHNQSKHYGAPSGVKKLKNVDKKKMRNWVIVIAVIVIIAGVSYYLAFKPETQGNYDEFAKCLTENNVTMFGAYWCPHCKDQKKLFGNSWQYVNYVECSLPNAAGTTEECIKEGIDGYPTWEINSTKVGGLLTLQQLSDRTNCTLP